MTEGCFYDDAAKSHRLRDCVAYALSELFASPKASNSVEYAATSKPNNTKVWQVDVRFRSNDGEGASETFRYSMSKSSGRMVPGSLAAISIP